jgi:hypothetical protein
MLQQEKQTFGSNSPNLPQSSVQIQVQSRQWCQEHILRHHPWMQGNERTLIWFKQEVEIDCKPRGFWSHLCLHQVYFQEEFLEKWHFSQAQYQAADLHKCFPTHLLLQAK